MTDHPLPPASPGADGTAAPAGGAAPRVLVIEDDLSISAIVAQVLREESFAVTCAANGREALTMLDGGLQPDVILLDVHMPVMDGPAFARAYGDRSGPRAAIVLLTADSGLEAAQHASDLSCAGFLTKPFDLADLITVVRRYSAPPDVPGSDAPMSSAPHTDRVTLPSVKETREADARRRELGRLSTLVRTLCEDLERVQAETQRLAEVEPLRTLSPDERRTVRQLRLETERLRLEIHAAWTEFERLRDLGRLPVRR